MKTISFFRCSHFSRLTICVALIAASRFATTGSLLLAQTDTADEEALILTPKPSPKPKINGAKVFGVRPGNPFLFTVPATGDRPMTFSSEGLPSGLELDAQTGRITGTLKQTGEYLVTLRAKNTLGTDERPFKIVCGSWIGLTPALGWNSWNAYGRSVSDELARKAADAMVKDTPYGRLIDHGWTYINLDDGWERSPREEDPLYEGPTRDPDTGKFLTNKKFPDMKALADYIHDKGLKFGVYSGPGPTTCQGLEASWQHEEIDAQTWAEWGVDYLKYDWCSYSRVANGADNTGQRRRGRRNFDRETLMKPYQVMRTALDKVQRDIIYSLCQYGWGNVWEWGADPSIQGNSWRTTGDIRDSWRSLSSNGFRLGGHEQYVGPGHFDDPDMLIVGMLGWGPRLHPTGLSPNEQYTHISLWCLLCSPMLLGCDLSQLDDFTLNLLCNDEVLAVDQDPLGRQASRVAQDSEAMTEVWAKPMEDGSKAVGLFNRSDEAKTVTVKWSDLNNTQWSDLKISGRQVARDLWRQQDVATVDDQYEATVPRHGVVLVKLTPAK